MRFRLLFFSALFLFAICGVANALDSGDTNQPYEKISGREVTFSQLTKNDLGLRCTVYLKEIPPEYVLKTYQLQKGMIVTRGKTVMVNGEFNELGKHFLVAVWYDKKNYFTQPFPIAAEEIDHIVLEKK